MSKRENSGRRTGRYVTIDDRMPDRDKSCTVQHNEDTNESDGCSMVPPLEPTDQDDQKRIRVEYFANENSATERLTQYLIKNRKYSIRLRILSLAIKIAACLMYVIRVVLDRGPITATCFGCEAESYKNPELVSEEDFLHNASIFYPALLWVDRSTTIWSVELFVALTGLLEAFILTFINCKGNFLRYIGNARVALPVVIAVPFVLTIFAYPLRNIFIPSFLNCWLLKIALEGMLNDVHRAFQKQQSAVSQRMLIVLCTVFCLLFTSTCGFQHLQRAGRRQTSLFQSFYLTIVTFSTVGYGEFYPDIWISQLFMIIMICIAFIVLPKQLEQLAITWIEVGKTGGEYPSRRARLEKHVVVTTTAPKADTLMDFLNEFYSHSKLQGYYVVLLSPCEMDRAAWMAIQNPLWSDRVTYLQGSALKETDLERARVAQAEACFILANRNIGDKSAASLTLCRFKDQHTILRSWSIKDFAPACPQYVQIFRPENKMHIKHADYVVCEDEFKYALLANNCECPGISTFITLLLHTSRGEEGQSSSEQWHRLYGKHSGNEIYHIRLGNSKFFGEYEGKSFVFASFHAHKRFGVGLVAVQPDEPGAPILLNPGPQHLLRNNDICFYMSITREEHSAVLPSATTEPLSKTGFVTRNGRKFLRRPCKVAGCNCCLDCESASEMLPLADNKNAEIKTNSSVHFTRKSLPGEDDDQATLPETADSDLLHVEHTDIPETNTKFCSNLHVELPARKASIASVPDQAYTRSVNDSLSSNSNAGGSNEHLALPEPPPHSTSPGQQSSSRSAYACRGFHVRYESRFPPVSPYIGTSATLCHLLKEKKQFCCLQLAQTCSHCSFKNAKEYNWQTRLVIVAADFASNGIYNFIVPLRAHFRPKHRLQPIVLLLEKKPDCAFLDSISWFPDVYWMLGSIDCLDDLLMAGITYCDHIVVVNKESSNSAVDDYLADSNSIVAVQTMHRLFASVRIITELTHTSNMRFMQFNAKDVYALHQSAIEKKEKLRGSHIAYMFRLPFAAGSIFSASMLDTLLYQAFVKDYLIQFVRLLLGIDQALGSGYLSSIEITEEDLWIRTYGRLYQKLCSTSAEIPIGIYRTQSTSGSIGAAVQGMSMEGDSMADLSLLIGRSGSCRYTVSERHEILNLVRCRMVSLGLPPEDYNYHTTDKRGTISFVILNPSIDLQLEEGDIVYVLKPSTQNLRRASSMAVNEMRKRQRLSSMKRVQLIVQGSENEPQSEAQPQAENARPLDSSSNRDHANDNTEHELSVL